MVQRSEWRREPVVVICSTHCSGKGRSLHHMSPRTYSFVAEPVVVREVYPWTVAIEEQPVAVVAELLYELVVVELRKRGM